MLHVQDLHEIRKAGKLSYEVLRDVNFQAGKGGKANRSIAESVGHLCKIFGISHTRNKYPATRMFDVNLKGISN